MKFLSGPPLDLSELQSPKVPLASDWPFDSLTAGCFQSFLCFHCLSHKLWCFLYIICVNHKVESWLFLRQKSVKLFYCKEYLLCESLLFYDIYCKRLLKCTHLNITYHYFMKNKMTRRKYIKYIYVNYNAENILTNETVS